jgi:hypothetical protein
MQLCDDPTSRPYAEYILQVGDGTEPPVLEGEISLLPHGNVVASVGIEIGLFPRIARKANLDGLINSVFLDFPNKVAEEGYMDGRAILTAKNVVVNQINTVLPQVCLVMSMYYFQQIQSKWETIEHMELPQSF